MPNRHIKIPHIIKVVHLTVVLIWRFYDFFNHQTKVTANTILRGVFYGNILAIGQYA